MASEWISNLKGTKLQISPTFLTQCSYESINVHVGEVGVKIGDGNPFQFDSINELNVVREINKEDI
jgi:hypothetical protein